MVDYFVILPIHLFKDNNYINQNTKVFIIEHPLYFTKYKYHKLKLILHRSTMKYYADYIQTKYSCKVKYYNYNDDYSNIFNYDLHMYDPVDHDILKEFKGHNILESPNFMETNEDIKTYTANKDKFIHHNFYKYQRIKHDILVKDNKPIGGKWSFDEENRW